MAALKGRPTDNRPTGVGDDNDDHHQEGAASAHDPPGPRDRPGAAAARRHGAGYEITPVLKPLEKFRDQMLVVSGLKAYWTPAHAGASTTFLTGAAGVRGETAPTAEVSMDQIVAREFEKETELASLELAIDG